MNKALLYFVADYLAGHAARTEPGDGALGRVLVDAQVGQCLELRFDSHRCHVALAAANDADCHLKFPWPRFVQLLDDECLYDSFDLDEPGRLYWFPSWLMHSGRNHSGDEERVFLLISQRFDDETRRAQGSIDTPL